MEKIDRRTFIKLALAAPVIGAVGITGMTDCDEKQELPKALLVDPYQVNVRDLEECNMPGRIKIVRLRRPSWGRGDPIRKIF